MTTTTPPTPESLLKDAAALARGAKTLSRDAGSVRAAKQFERVLQRVLSLSDPHESDVISMALEALLQQDDEHAMDWLLEEIEIESELQYIQMGKTGKERACLLFAIPVVMPASTAAPVTLPYSTHFETLHTILTDANVIGEDARFRLIPRLFTHEELRGRPFGDFMRLTRELGRQLLERGATDVQVDDTIFPPPVIALPPDASTPYVDLRYLIGILVTTHEGLETAFPAFDDDTYGSAGDSPDAGTTSLQDEVIWQSEFAEVLEAWSGRMLGVLNVAPPVGFHEDLRFGLELAREFNCRLHFQSVLDGAGLGVDDVAIAEVPFSSDGQDVCGITLALLNAGDEELDTAVWPALAHEELDDAVDKLHDLLTQMGFAAADELFSCDTVSPSYLLH